jgi:hypothetical protein
MDNFFEKIFIFPKNYFIKYSMDIAHDVWTKRDKFITKLLHLLIGLPPINQVLSENLMFFYKLTPKK